MSRASRLLSALGLLIVVMSCPDIHAALSTDVLDAADGMNDPIDFSIEVQFVQDYQWATVSRERNTFSETEPDMLNQNEFEIKELKNILNVNGRIGMYHDLEFHFNLPIHIKDSSEAYMSSHFRNKFWGGGFSLDTLAEKGRPSLLTDAVFGYAGWNAAHKGFGDMLIGFTYGIFSNERDPDRPSFNVTLDLELPTGSQNNPDMGPTAINPQRGKVSTGVGEKLVSFIFRTDLSMRFNAADPYFGIYYKVPISTGGHISDPRQEGGFRLGTEIIAYEKIPETSPEPLWKVAFDLGMNINLYGRGQDFNEITDALAWRKDLDTVEAWPVDPRSYQVEGEPQNVFFEYSTRPPDYELPVNGRYAHIQGKLGFYTIFYHYIMLKTQVLAGHRTEHFLSLPSKLDENTLRPSDKDGYNTQINEIGARVKLQKSFTLAWNLSLALLY